MGSEADVRPEAEGEVTVVRAIQHALRRIRKGVGVEVCGGEPKGHNVAFADGRFVQLHICSGIARREDDG